ncbi:MAG: M14 family zinc carboxypeptidase [Nitrosotalea sp.]
MSWMTVDEINQKIKDLAGITLARWPVSKIQPEKFLLGKSAANFTGTGAAASYREGTSFEINALKIPSRVKSKPYEGGVDHLSVLITGGVLGNELIGPEASLHFAKLFLDAVQNYEKVDSSQQTTQYKQASDVTIGKYTIDHTDLEEILEKLNIWVVPLVNPGGRDYYLSNPGFLSGRMNPNGVCINRNFDIGWDFKKLFTRAGWGMFYNSMDPKNRDPGDPVQFYQGPRAESEPETQALVKLMCKDAHIPSGGDPSITWLFDIHGQNAPVKSNVSYPWSWAENQVKKPAMCLGNHAYDPPALLSRDGFISLTIRPNTYGEYLPARTLDQLEALADKFTTAAKNCNGSTLWKSPEQGGKGFSSVGDLDDYFLWLDRNHCRAFTIECADLQPNSTLKNVEMDEVSAGLFEAIKQIKDWVSSSSDPEENYSRLSTNQLTCP